MQFQCTVKTQIQYARFFLKNQGCTLYMKGSYRAVVLNLFTEGSHIQTYNFVRKPH